MSIDIEDLHEIDRIVDQIKAWVKKAIDKQQLLFKETKPPQDDDGFGHEDESPKYIDSENDSQ